MAVQEEYPNKYLDEELNYMKEIREAYFEPRDHELREARRYEDSRLRKYESPYEISDKKRVIAVLGKMMYQSDEKIKAKKTVDIDLVTLLR